MSKMLQLARVTNDDGSRNIAKMLLLGAGCVASVAGATYLSYKIYNRYITSPHPKSATGLAEKPPPVDGVTVPLEPLAIAMKLKEEGNSMFKAKRYEEAREFYTQAIEKCPSDESKTLAIFHQNRAATNDALKLWAEVVKDCDEALTRDDKYQKAYSRRGKAKLALKQYEEAVVDTACGYYLQEKKTKPNQDLFEQAMSEKCRIDCITFMETRDPVPIGEECVRSYVSNFPNDPVLRDIKQYATPAEGQERTPFQEACAKLENKCYNEVLGHLNEELALEDSPHLKQSLLLRATFLTLAGCPKKAEQDLDRLLTMDDLEPRLRSTALMRRGLIHVARMDSQRGIGDMLKASEVDPTNADTFHHRGQIALLMQDFVQCQQDTAQALKLQESEDTTNPNILFQKYMCDLQTAQSQQNFGEFEVILGKMEKVCSKYPKDGECWCLYAQALIFFGQYPEAEKVYARAIANCADNPRIYIQRAAMMLTWKKDVKLALEYLMTANEIDKTCESVYENIAILHLQQGQQVEALEYFKKQLEYSRTALDCQNTLTMVESIKAQRLMKEKFGLIVANVFNFGGVPA